MEIVRERRYGVVDFCLFQVGSFFEYNDNIYLKIRPSSLPDNTYNCNTDVVATFCGKEKVIPLNGKVVIE